MSNGNSYSNGSQMTYHHPLEWAQVLITMSAAVARSGHVPILVVASDSHCIAGVGQTIDVNDDGEQLSLDVLVPCDASATSTEQGALGQATGLLSMSELSALDSWEFLVLETGSPARCSCKSDILKIERGILINISSPSKKELCAFLKKVSSRVPNLNVVDADVPLNILCQHDEKLEQVALGREFHISLGRTVPIRVHQIDSVISMLKQKLHIQRHRYWIEFNKWEVFINDDHTRTFLSVEVVQRGLIEDPRPHISLAWSLGDIAHSLKKVVDEEMKYAAGKSFKSIFSCKFKGIECKIGKKAYAICKIPDGQ
ncbi:hypothetical protein V8G54_025849 [Vigna mungo]|uniref:U6 snRNA phosphodiesterase 1 n=1 Tax=Vigna mungo TaxID=3915 RepID=A0AAQ3MZQ8_VIGMU